MRDVCSEDIEDNICKKVCINIGKVAGWWRERQHELLHGSTHLNVKVTFMCTIGHI